MLELFKTELETNSATLENGLVAVEDNQNEKSVEPLMRAAHSVKGAARIVGLDGAVSLAHAMEDVFVAVQKGEYRLNSEQIDVLISCNDIFSSLASLETADIPTALKQQANNVESLIERLHAFPAWESSASAGQQTAPPKSELSKEPSPEIEVSRPAPVSDTDQSVSIMTIEPEMIKIFLMDLETNSTALEQNLLALEDGADSKAVESLMRAAHSIKGAARIVNLNLEISMAHSMEDIFNAVQQGKLTLTAPHIDVLLKVTDVFRRLSQIDPKDYQSFILNQAATVKKLSTLLLDILEGRYKEPLDEDGEVEEFKAPGKAPEEPKSEYVRVLSGAMNKILGLSGEILILAKNARNMSSVLFDIKNSQFALAGAVDQLAAATQGNTDRLEESRTTRDLLDKQVISLSQYIEEYETFSRRLERLSDKLNSEIVSSRMVPFSTGIHGFTRMVRDLAKSLGKKVTFSIEGQQTLIDREILERLEAPLTHLLRNALDHGIESPESRAAAGKDPIGHLTLSARHTFGKLIIMVKDDGCGVDIESLKKKIVEKGYVEADFVNDLTKEEVLEFMFLPGFSTRDKVSEISGRGVGLDIVNTMLQSFGSSAYIDSEPALGTTIELHLPITISVLKTLLLDIDNECYAIPLTQIVHTLEVPIDELETVEGREYCMFEEHKVGIVDSRQVLGLPKKKNREKILNIIILRNRNRHFGIVVDAFLGDSTLSVRPLDPRLKKVPVINAGAILEDGSPVLILEAEDIIISISNLLSGKIVETVGESAAVEGLTKRVLVVDDSITVREMERKLLENKGFDVVTAVDGMDGWNMLMKKQQFDLIISDVDMPRMTGLEFVAKIKSDQVLKDIPVIIISYKDREEDRKRGMEAGADYYLSKSCFHDGSFHEAVGDLTGEGE